MRSLLIAAAVAVVASAAGGCDRPKGAQGRTITQGAGTSSAGPKEPCVGLGCDGGVSVGMKKGCVGMGCPPADAQQPE